MAGKKGRSGVYLRKAGRKLSEEHKKHLSESLTGLMIGDKNPMFGKHFSETTRRKISESMRGKHLPMETRKKISESLRILKNSDGKGGLKLLVNRIRDCFKYRQWRSDVFEKYNYTCQKSGQKIGEIESHHIKSLSKIIEEYQIKTLEQALVCEELWNINNGITLMRAIHQEFHKIYGQKNNNKEQLEEFLK